MALPTLQLTFFVKESETPGVFIGRINEISGIFAQANSEAEVRDDLIKNTYIMLQYKRQEAIDLLRKQVENYFEEILPDAIPQFTIAFSSKYLEVTA